MVISRRPTGDIRECSNVVLSDTSTNSSRSSDDDDDNYNNNNNNNSVAKFMGICAGTDNQFVLALL